MKKRRELDALVNVSKQSNGGRVKNGRHELLRNESESSEVEEFSMTQNTAARKRTRCHCCSMCWPVCSAFLLVLCISFIAVLTFLLVQLKNEVYQLQSNLHDVEVTAKDIPVQFTKLSEEHQTLEKSVSELKQRGDGDLPMLRTTVNSLTTQISAINATLIPLKQSPAVTSQTALHQLQSDYNKLSRNFADTGSRVEAEEKEREKLQQQITNIVNSLLSTTQSPLSSIKSDKSGSAASPVDTLTEEEIHRFVVELGIMNSTLRGQLDRLGAETSAQKSMLASLYNQTSLLESRLKSVQQQQQQSSSTGALSPTLHAAITNIINAQLTSRLQEASYADVNSSWSAALDEMKRHLTARIQALELLDANRSQNIASIASELNCTKEALNQATSNITDSVQLLAQTTGSIAVRLEAVEESITNLRSQVTKSVQSSSTTASAPTFPQPSARPDEVGTSSPASSTTNEAKEKTHTPVEYVPPSTANSRRRPVLGAGPSILPGTEGVPPPSNNRRRPSLTAKEHPGVQHRHIE